MTIDPEQQLPDNERIRLAEDNGRLKELLRVINIIDGLWSRSDGQERYDAMRDVREAITP